MQNILLLFIISTLRNINLLNLHILKMTLFIYIVKNAMRELGVLFFIISHVFQECVSYASYIRYSFSILLYSIFYALVLNSFIIR